MASQVPIQFSFSFDTVKLRSADRLLYNYKRADFSHFESVLDHVPWNTIDFDTDVLYYSFTVSSTEGLQQHVLQP